MKDLIKISECAYRNIPVENAACLIDEENLMRIHRKMDGRKVKGIDEVSKEDYDNNIKKNLKQLV